MNNDGAGPLNVPNTEPCTQPEEPLVQIVNIGVVTPSLPQRHDWKKRVAAFSGNFLEWYDFSVYGYFSDTIGQNFFPEKNKGLNLAFSFLIFGSAFFARPIGSIVLGRIGDRYGSKAAIEIAILMMGISSCCIAFLPPYDMAGITGAILLVIFRVLQGFSMGGQYVGSLMFAAHGSPRNEYGYEFSIAALSGNCGFLFGNIVSMILRNTLNPEQLHDWGWRIPFLIAVLACPASMYLRVAVEDEQVNENESINHVKESLSCWNLRPMLCFVSVTALGSCGSYILFIWLPMYMNVLAKPHIKHPFVINTIAQSLSQILLLPLGGKIVDKSNKAIVLFVCIVAQIILFPIGFKLIQDTKNAYVATAVMSIVGCFNGCLNPAAMFTYFFPKFPSKIRMTSMGFSYNVASAVFGGFSPAAATFLHKINHFAPAYLMVGSGFCALLGLTGALTYEPPEEAFNRLSTDISIGERTRHRHELSLREAFINDDKTAPLLRKDSNIVPGLDTNTV